MPASTQSLIEDYLTEIRSATRSLPRGQQETIVSDLESHIEQALPPGASEAEVRTVLGRLGTAESIASEAGATEASGSPTRLKEIIALVGISIGSLVLPFIGWIVGVVLVWMSPVWTRVQKVAATLIWPLGWFGILYLPLISIRAMPGTLSDGNVGELLVGVLIVLAPLVVLGWLIRSLVRADNR